MTATCGAEEKSEEEEVERAPVTGRLTGGR
jgi:hypothetical protein